tara:strand:+ start:9678 stop:10166 length:489 start_codon:yes stop_codon:yes gene_type:complete
MTLFYRRTSLDRDTTFYVPKVTCFACNDSGIVANGDNAINKYIPDYDKTSNGKINGGQDLAVICHCDAAYGKDDTSGLRENNGNIRQVQNFRGEMQCLGFSLEKDKIRQIHIDRKASWEATAKEINTLRSKRAKGEKVETPYYIQVVKEELGNINSMFNFPK